MPINARLPLPNRILFRLRNILLVVMFAVLGLPLIGVYFFRIYENGLVQQTETELIAQATVMAATFRQYSHELAPKGYGYILMARSPIEPTKRLPTVRPATRETITDNGRYTPIPASLDLINDIAPPRPAALSVSKVPDTIARAIAEKMLPIMQDTQQVMLSGMRLLDMDGTVIVGREEIGWSLAHIPEVKRALNGQYASVIRQRISDQPPPPLYSLSRGTQIRVFIAYPIVDQGRLQGVVYLSRTPTNILKHLYEVRDKVMFATCSLLLVAVLLVLFVSSTISRPIRELLRQTERVRTGEQRIVQPIRHPVTYEVAQLSESFAGMSQALAERSDYIRRFAAHVSHEFKTPLTAMQGALELLQDHFDSMPSEQRDKFMGNLLVDTQRLKQLVNRLLELARADALEPNKQSSSLPELFKSLLNRYQERGLLIQLPEDLSALALAIAPEALESVLCNLLDNSLQHGATQMQVQTQLLAKSLKLSLADNGEGVSAANRDKIFTPFFTTKRNQGGTGLGLEIVVSLLRAYGGQIYLGEASEGAEFVMELMLEPAQLSNL
jgi:signal transduction histidine kinase